MFLGSYLARTINETNNLTYLFHKQSFCYLNHSIILPYSNSFKALSHGAIFLATCNAILLSRDAN